MTLTEFLLARIAEDELEANASLEQWARGDGGTKARWVRALAECEVKRRIVEWHANWPVLVETEPTFSHGPTDLTRITMTMSQRVGWFTEREYRERFGEDPPTGP